MKIFSSLQDFPRPEYGCVLTIGNFDGVHLGHQAIIKQARKIAQEHGLPLVAMTFEPSPVQILAPNKAPQIITPLELKTRLLKEQYIEQLVIVNPTPDFLSLSAEEFVRQVIAEEFGARHVVEGQTFSFGQRRSGTMVSLQALARRAGFQTHLVPAHTVVTDPSVGAVAVSSTLVRQQISLSHFDKASKCLGRPYALLGKVVAGKGKGRELGFPTANLQLASRRQAMPEDGSFAGYVKVADDSESLWLENTYHPAALSIGRPVTFDDPVWRIEAFLLDYAESMGSLYDKHMMIVPVERIRPQIKFTTSQELVQAIEADCRKVCEILERKGPLD
jgi:riboflavin kinase/FMN adenylyltransferase